MKYLSLNSVKKAFMSCREVTQNKFWGLLSILTVIDKEIVPGTSYPVHTGNIANILEGLFRLETYKKKYDSDNQWSVIFSDKWLDEIPELMLSGKPNIYQIAVWFLRNESFSDDVTNESFLSILLNRIHLSKLAAESIFNFTPIDIEFSDSRYSEDQLLDKISEEVKAVPENFTYKTLSFEGKPFIKSNPGALGQAPFIQTLYASQGVQKCLIITQFIFHDFYHISNGNIDLPQNKIDMNLQQIYYGAPGTGKSHKINKLTAGESVIRTTFHPDSDYSTFVGAYKPTTREVELRDVSGHKIVENSSVVREERIVYEFVAQAFLQAYANAWKLYAENPIEPAKQYLVIEEINRGNCAQIFGDLFQLLDRNDYGFSDYPIAADSDLGKYLKKELAGLILSNADSINSMYNGRDVVSEILNGKILLLPNNLYIWATMNTSDQSLFPIDSAFKRRWEWKYIPIDTEKEKWSISVNGKSYSWSSFLKQINNEIDDTTHSEDKKLGFYFCKATDGVISAEKFVSKVLFYLYNDVFKDYGFSREFFKDANGKTIPFQMFFNCSDGSTNEYATETILKNLKVDLMENAVAVDTADVTTDTSEDEMLDDDGNTPSSSTRDYSKYSINHEGRYDKRSLVRNTITIFIRQHSELPDDEIISKWKSLNVFNKFVLTESEYNRELDSSSDRSGRQSRFFDFELPNSHTHMYVYNQFNVGSIEVFISKVNAQDWGIHLEKIE